MASLEQIVSAPYVTIHFMIMRVEVVVLFVIKCKLCYIFYEYTILKVGNVLYNMCMNA